MLNNICSNDQERPLIGNSINAEQHLDNFSGSSNIWYYPDVSEVPTWDDIPYTDDPLYSSIDIIFSLALGSPALNKSVTTPESVTTPFTISHDIYGTPRSIVTAIGAVEFSSKPNPPSGLSIK